MWGKDGEGRRKKKTCSFPLINAYFEPKKKKTSYTIKKQAPSRRFEYFFLTHMPRGGELKQPSYRFPLPSHTLPHKYHSFKKKQLLDI